MTIDRFDEAFDPPAKPTPHYDIAPVGEHTVEVVRAESRCLPWRVTATNPEGRALSLRVRVGPQFAYVLADVPDDLGWLRRRLAEAVGIEVDACVPEQLVGRRITVVIDHVPTRDGGTRAIVRRWLPVTTPAAVDPVQPETSPTRPAARRSRNALKRHTPDDGMPF